MKKIKYPRYTEDEDLRIKLTKRDLIKLRKLVNFGVSKKIIAKIFGINIRTVYEKLLEGEELAERLEMKRLSVQISRERMNPILLKERTQKSNAKFFKRKYKLKKLYKKYKQMLTARFFKKYPDKKWKRK